MNPPQTTYCICSGLSKVFDQALEGGGAKNFNFQELAADLAQITFDYPFKIPPYFALIIRAIGVLEGIALVGNPDFALVDEAYPYLSKRLLTDDSEELRASLRLVMSTQCYVTRQYKMMCPRFRQIELLHFMALTLRGPNHWTKSCVILSGIANFGDIKKQGARIV